MYISDITSFSMLERAEITEVRSGEFFVVSEKAINCYLSIATSQSLKLVADNFFLIHCITLNSALKSENELPVMFL